MNIEEAISKNNKVYAITDRQICVFTKNIDSYSDCFDTLKNKQLDIADITDDYELDIIDNSDECRIDVFIPSGAKCTLTKGSNPNYDCKIIYKNIECDLYFENEPIDTYFSLLDE